MSSLVALLFLALLGGLAARAGGAAVMPDRCLYHSARRLLPTV